MKTINLERNKEKTKTKQGWFRVAHKILDFRSYFAWIFTELLIRALSK